LDPQGPPAGDRDHRCGRGLGHGDGGTRHHVAALAGGDLSGHRRGCPHRGRRLFLHRPPRGGGGRGGGGAARGRFPPRPRGGPAVADFVQGLVASWTSTTFAVVGGGLLCVVLALVAGWLGPSLRRYDAQAPTVPAG